MINDGLIKPIQLLQIMTNRYGTLDVSLNLSRSGNQRLNKTIQASSESDGSERPNDEKTNKFKQLYYKNQKLRKQLKLLNEKLNQKLDKLKLPSVKKKAMSVDLNRSPPSKPSKALVRQLQNGYKQIAFYKKQVESLKGKEQSIQNYEKFRGVENMITYMDRQIGKVQQELTSIKNIHKIQNKVMSEDIENAEIKQRLRDYEKEIKGYKDKLKQLDKKSRKREQQFKKQQAYLSALSKKHRKLKNQDDQLQKPEAQNEKNKQISELQAKQALQEYRIVKTQYDSSCKRIEGQRNKIKQFKKNRTLYDQKFLEKQNEKKQLQIMIESYTRLLKDLEIKKYEQSGVKEDRPKWQGGQSKEISKILKLEEIQDDDESEDGKKYNVNPSNVSRRSSFIGSKGSSIKNTSFAKDERNWKGKMKKVSMGYTMPTDETFTQNGIILGFRTFLDENRYIVGITPIVLVDQTRYEAQTKGDTTSVVLAWQVDPGDHICEIAGSFTDQGYLAELKLLTWKGSRGTFGYPQNDTFKFNVEQGQYFSGIFGGLRKLGQDVRITQIGFWILKS